MFHGADDPIIPVEESRRMAAELPHARYTEYPGVGHGSWLNAYAEPELWRWLFANVRAEDHRGGRKQTQED